VGQEPAGQLEMHIPDDDRYGNEELVTHALQTEGPVQAAHVDWQARQILSVSAYVALGHAVKHDVPLKNILVSGGALLV